MTAGLAAFFGVALGGESICCSIYLDDHVQQVSLALRAGRGVRPG